MAHQVVIREDHTTSKLRIVYDASSKLKGPSLNDWLEAGEEKYTDLFGTFIRIRLHNAAVAADIEKAFLNIGIQKMADALRFLWKEDLFDTTSKLWVLRFTRVGFGIEDHPYINPDIINKIKYSLYETICQKEQRNWKMGQSFTFNLDRFSRKQIWIFENGKAIQKSLWCSLRNMKKEKD